MPTMTAQQVLDRHFLEIRCELLNLAAALDRIERHAEADQARTDPRMADIRQGLEILSREGDDRAERIQILFSDLYREGWNR
ncbi:MAG: hypothetical protein ACK5Q5_10895 [Planctomycetaceae bacterium]